MLALVPASLVKTGLNSKLQFEISFSRGLASSWRLRLCHVATCRLLFDQPSSFCRFSSLKLLIKFFLRISAASFSLAVSYQPRSRPSSPRRRKALGTRLVSYKQSAIDFHVVIFLSNKSFSGNASGHESNLLTDKSYRVCIVSVIL